MRKLLILIAFVLPLAGCAWESDFRERQQPEDYLEQTEPVVIP